MHRILFLLLLSLTVATSCSEDQFLAGVTAERAYIDLVYAISHNDTLESRAAATRLLVEVDNLRSLAFRPLRQEDVDDRSYHLERAGCAFADALVSVDIGWLDLASVQLDRAVFELQAADGAVFNELYVGGIYDFASAWLAVDALAQQSASSAEVPSDCITYALGEWKHVLHLRPDPVLYPDLALDPQPYLVAHAALQQKLADLSSKIDSGIPVTVADVHSASAAFWNLLELFGTDKLPSEISLPPGPVDAEVRPVIL